MGKSGEAGKKAGRNAAKCALYRAHKGGVEKKKIVGSHKARRATPLFRHEREVAEATMYAMATKGKEKECLPFAYIKAVEEIQRIIHRHVTGKEISPFAKTPAEMLAWRRQ